MVYTTCGTWNADLLVLITLTDYSMPPLTRIRGKMAGAWNWQLYSYRTEVQNAWSFTSSSSIHLHGVTQGQLSPLLILMSTTATQYHPSPGRRHWRLDSIQLHDYFKFDVSVMKVTATVARCSGEQWQQTRWRRTAMTGHNRMTQRVLDTGSCAGLWQPWRGVGCGVARCRESNKSLMAP
jgi:hypothetical protein